MSSLRFPILLLILTTFTFSAPTEATYRNRVSLMTGMIKLYSQDKMKLNFGMEIEHRIRRWIGIGIMGNYVLSDPPTTIIAVPEFFLHPFDDNGFFSIAPIFQSQDGKAKAGLRLGSRILIPMWLLRIGPVFDYDIIGGGKQYMIGIGLEIHGI